jgi:predicted N-acetyltransferase YhbS
MTHLYFPENQTNQDNPAVERLLDLTFGISRSTKTSYRLREGNSAAEGMSLVVREAGFGLVGAISFWPLEIGQSQTSALLLGPLAVHPQRQNLGIGRALMNEGLLRAKARGHALVVLIGDEPYYARVGFARVPEGQIQMPGPFDPRRLLFLELAPKALANAKGLALAPWRWRQIIALRATT